MIETGLYSYISANVSGITFYAGFLPQNPTYPCIVYLKTSSDRYLSYDGAGTTEEATFQIDVISESYSTAKTKANLMITALHGYSGLMGSSQVYKIDVVDDFDIYEDTLEVFRISVIVTIAYGV